jgi:outer membrane lipoprotein-sorting protein
LNVFNLNVIKTMRQTNIGKWTLYGLLPVLALLCIGWADSWDAIRATEPVQSVRADFIQEKHLPILARPLVSKGRLLFQAPQSLRWEYQEPIRSILTMHAGKTRRFVAGSSGWIEERGPGLEVMQVVLQEITYWMAGRFDENPSFEAHLEPGGRIVLTPRQEAFGALIERIVLNLGPLPGTMQSVEIHESQEAFTRLTFSHMQLNQPIDEKEFGKAP